MAEAVDKLAQVELARNLQPVALLIRGRLAVLEKQMSAGKIAAGQKRTKELQKEIDAKISAKAAGK